MIDKPIGCGSVMLTGPAAPTLGKAECYSVFSSSGALSNVGDSYITGDVGSNSGAVSGFDPLLITGVLHPIPDVSTAMSANDLLIDTEQQVVKETIGPISTEYQPYANKYKHYTSVEAMLKPYLKSNFGTVIR